MLELVNYEVSEKIGKPVVVFSGLIFCKNKIAIFVVKNWRRVIGIVTNWPPIYLFTNFHCIMSEPSIVSPTFLFPAELAPLVTTHFKYVTHLPTMTLCNFHFCFSPRFPATYSRLFADLKTTWFSLLIPGTLFVQFKIDVYKDYWIKKKTFVFAKYNCVLCKNMNE